MRQSMDSGNRNARILAVVAATVISLSCGTNYGFSAWAPQFAARLGLTATQTNLIGNFGNIGMYAMGIPGGILIDTRGSRWGVLAGTIGLACGYLPLRSAYVRGPGSFGMPALCFFALLTGVGSCTAFSASLKVCATNWPQHRGTATAFPLSAFGLSAFFYTALAALIFPDDTSGYLFLLALGTTVMTFVGMLFLRTVPPTQVGSTAGHYQPVAVGASPTEDRSAGVWKRDDDHNSRKHRTGSSTRSGNAIAKGTNELGTAEETASLVGSSRSSSRISAAGHIDDDSKPASSHAAHHSHAHQHRPEITGWALLRTPAFWQLFFLLSLLCGVGLMTINNIGNAAKSLWHHYDDSASRDFIQKRQLMHVSILSVCSFLGRLASGIGSDALLHRGASRYWTLVASALLFVAAQAVALTVTNPHNLFLLSGTTGLAYGCLFGVYPALVADAFGPTGMGINWGAMTWAPVLSGNIFNLCYGAILDRHSVFRGTPGGSGPGERVCDDGRDCYAAAYYITLAASVAGLAWTLVCIGREKHEATRRERDVEARDHDV